MLQFWKKAGREQTGLLNPSTSVRVNKCEQPSNGILQLVAKTDNKGGPLTNFECEDVSNKECSSKPRSMISRKLSEILNDKCGLSYFIQFMESQHAVAYILCWLDIDTLKLDLPKICTNKIEHDSLSVSTDCDSYTADSNSLYEDSAAENKCSNSQEFNSNCDQISDISNSSPRIYQNSSYESGSKRTLLDNALVIFKKYIAQEAGLNVRCPDNIRNEVIECICDKNVPTITESPFDKVQSYVFDAMDRDYFEAFLASDYFCKYQIDIFTSGTVLLDDILHNEMALFYFMEFLEHENARSVLEFWIAVSNFHEQLRYQGEFFDGIEAQNDAVVLYDKYISLQAHCPLGFSDGVRLAVEQTICGENGIILDCFDLPLRIVENFLDKFYLKPFLTSQLFYKFLSELINTVQLNGYSTSLGKFRRSCSDLDSERSFASSQLLAIEMKPNNDKREKSDMTIDARELYDPDSLWKRKTNHRLSCGRVTDMGKFETDFEPEPDKKSFLRDVVKKFVSLEDVEKKKEEMAWQVAEMIVKDIMDVTLNDNDVQSLT